jgi:hypothetical protein
MAIACSIHGEEVECRSENVEEKDHIKDVDIDDRKTVNLIFKIQDGRAWT